MRFAFLLPLAAWRHANKRLPFNGIVAAVAGDPSTGSWAFQILPYVDQTPLFANNPPNKSVGALTYMCLGRGRPVVSTTGAWTDYFINPWGNDSVAGKPNAPDARRTLIGMTDGTSNTIMFGHGGVDPNLYSAK